MTARVFIGVCAFMIVSAGATGLILQQRAARAADALTAGVSVEPLWPSQNAYVSGKATLRFTVQGLSPDQYEPFWSVDNGGWNRMTSDPNNGAVNVDTIDVSSWNWNPSGNYTLTFTALLKGSWQPVQTTVSMHVGAAPVSAPVAATNVKQSAPAPAAASTSTQSIMQPKTDQSLYAYPTGEISLQATQTAAGDPANASLLRRLASQPIAQWFGSWESDMPTDVDHYVSAAAAAKQIPVLVAYNIPQRDCGGYSSGGASDGQGYIQWIRAFARGIGQRRAIVVLEPDASANLDCLSSGDQQNRLQLLSQAVATLKANSGTSVYLDAGHPNWHTPSAMASRLQSAGLSQADGFSLNVSNFISTDVNVSYGNQISQLTGGKHFVIDTSRNGNGQTSDDQWCNPAGRAVGQTPTLQTGSSLVDAYLWIKGPGASDGTCGPSINGSWAPYAGAWWPQYALQLLRNAGW